MILPSWESGAVAEGLGVRVEEERLSMFIPRERYESSGKVPIWQVRQRAAQFVFGDGEFESVSGKERA